MQEKNCKDLQNKKVYQNHLCHSHLANNVLVEKAMIAILRLFPHCVPRTHLDKSNCSRVFSLFKDYQSNKKILPEHQKILPEQQKDITGVTKRYYQSNKKVIPEQQKISPEQQKILPEQQKNIA